MPWKPSIFSNTDIKKFLYWLIECLQLNSIFVSGFNDLAALGTWERQVM